MVVVSLLAYYGRHSTCLLLFCISNLVLFSALCRNVEGLGLLFESEMCSSKILLSILNNYDERTFYKNRFTLSSLIPLDEAVREGLSHHEPGLTLLFRSILAHM